MSIPPRSLLCGAERVVVCRGLILLLKELARSCFREVAGFGLGSVDGGGVRVDMVIVGCNEADNPHARFRVDAQTLYNVVRVSEETGRDVVLVFHTHPGGRAFLSPWDLQGIEAWPVAWMVAGSDGVRAWLPCGEGVREVRVEPVDVECRVAYPTHCSPC